MASPSPKRKENNITNAKATTTITASNNINDGSSSSDSSDHSINEGIHVQRYSQTISP